MNRPKRQASAETPTTKPALSVRSPLRSIENSSSNNSGRWHEWEHLLFLQGMRQHGQGKWTKISEMIPTRTATQVKTHGQRMLKRLKEGDNVFEELDRFEGATHKNAATPVSPLDTLQRQDFDAAHTLLSMRT